jgi:hypothetical protein
VVQVFDVKGVFCCNAGFPESGAKWLKTSGSISSSISSSTTSAVTGQLLLQAAPVFLNRILQSQLKPSSAPHTDPV